MVSCKEEIKNEIEKLFGVKVVNVNTANAVQKKRRVGRYTVWYITLIHMMK